MNLRSAEFSECGRYRFQLTRIWDDSKKVAMCIGLNPSKAGSIKDDPTISRLTSVLKHLGYGGLRMTNLYSFITSKPNELYQVADPLKNNDEWLATTAIVSQEIIFCWGAFPHAEYRAKKIIGQFPDALCFGKNKDGSPWHPLAMMYAGQRVDQATLRPYRQRTMVPKEK